MIRFYGQWLILLLFAKLAGGEIVVEPSGAVRSLTAALQMAEEGDRIVVNRGVYREGGIVIDKMVEIIGHGNPVFDGENQYQVMTVRANGVLIRGITVSNCGVSFIDDKAGILVEEANDCVIEDNQFENNFFAIYLSKNAGTQIRNNRIHGAATTEAASGNGIHLWYCRDVVIENNLIQEHRDGIYFEFVEDGVVRNNHSEKNLRYGLHFMFSDRCRYRENTFRDNGAGVAVMYSKNVVMVDNRFEYNWGSASFGLLLKDITDSRIGGNVFWKNSIGLYAENSNRMQVEANQFLENGWAVKIMANCLDNHFSRNNFIGNSLDVVTNSRNNFSHFEGNYWHQYRGYDLDRDGYGDVPYRPVRLFSVIVQQHPEALILQRSFFIELLDIAEKIFPVLTPETLVDQKPALARIAKKSAP